MSRSDATMGGFHFRAKPMSVDRQPNLVIFRIGSLGDTVVALPCFHAIARAFPKHRKVLLTNALDSARASSVEAVLEGTGLIDEALYFPAGRGKLSHSVALARQLRQLDAKELVYLAPRTTGLQVYRDLLFFRAAGIRHAFDADVPHTKRLVDNDMVASVWEPLSRPIEVAEERHTAGALSGGKVHRTAVMTDEHIAAAENCRGLTRCQLSTEIQLCASPELRQALRQRALIRRSQEHERYGRYPYL